MIPDRDRPGGFLVELGGMPSSYLRPDQPSHLEFPYLRWAARALAAVVPEPAPLAVLHLGGAGCTFARYLAHNRPRSRQLIFESDPQMVAFARETLGYSRRSGFRLRHSEALAGLRELPADSWHVVFRDAFVGHAVPQHLTTVEYLAQIDRVLPPTGIYLANVADTAGSALLRREIATAVAVFPEVQVIGPPAQIRGKKYGNAVLIAHRGHQDLSSLAALIRKDTADARLWGPAQCQQLAAGASPLLESSLTTAADSSSPPGYPRPKIAPPQRQVPRRKAAVDPAR